MDKELSAWDIKSIIGLTQNRRKIDGSKSY